MDHNDVRSVGAEHVIYETMKKSSLPDLFISLGFNRPATDCALGVIAAKLISPSSERATHIWLQNASSVDDLLDTDFKSLSQERVYKAADMLLKNKTKIERYLRAKESNLFDLTEKIILYDLTNTFFEGLKGRYNDKAHFGNSKEKRRDCPLVTLALVLGADGFPKRTVFPGNISEPGTLKEIISCLSPRRQDPLLLLMQALPQKITLPG